MPSVFSDDRRRIGSIKAAKGGATAAWNCHHKRIGTFVSVDLAITALMDIAAEPLEPVVRMGDGASHRGRQMKPQAIGADRGQLEGGQWLKFAMRRDARHLAPTPTIGHRRGAGDTGQEAYLRILVGPTADTGRAAAPDLDISRVAKTAVLFPRL
jgi:hypothetical protein